MIPSGGWSEFDPWEEPEVIRQSTTSLINDAELNPAQRKGLFATLDAIRALPEVGDEYDELG